MKYENVANEFLQINGLINLVYEGTPQQEQSARTKLAEYLRETFGHQIDPGNENLLKYAEDETGAYFLPMIKDTFKDYFENTYKRFEEKFGKGKAGKVLTPLVEKLKDRYRLRVNLEEPANSEYIKIKEDFESIVKGVLSEGRAREIIRNFVDEIFEEKGKTSEKFRKYITNNEELKRIVTEAYVKERNSDPGSKAVLLSVIKSKADKMFSKYTESFKKYFTEIYEKFLRKEDIRSYQKVKEVIESTQQIEGLEKMDKESLEALVIV